MLQMRLEVEHLHQSQQQLQASFISSPDRGRGGGAGAAGLLENTHDTYRNESESSLMETRLRQATGEVSKLQKERRRLMEISNELQAQLRRVGGEVSDYKQQLNCVDDT